MSFDKKEYQRAYMRKKREKTLSGGASNSEASAGNQNEVESASPPAQNNLPVPVLAEPEKRQPEKSLSDGEARESTSKPKLDEETRTAIEEPVRGGQSFSYDKKKYPNRWAWEIAVWRVERAVRYDQMFPHLIGSDDRKFQTLDWQYQNEGLKVPAS